jgi:hypothetical protein
VPPQAQRLITLGLNNSLAKIIPCSHEISWKFSWKNIRQMLMYFHESSWHFSWNFMKFHQPECHEISWNSVSTGLVCCHTSSLISWHALGQNCGLQGYYRHQR